MKWAYCVMGVAGEYDDWRTWPVCIYIEQEKAYLHAEYASNAAQAILKTADDLKLNYVAREKLINPYDPVSGCIDRSTAYNVEILPILEDEILLDEDAVRAALTIKVGT